MPRLKLALLLAALFCLASIPAAAQTYSGVYAWCEDGGASVNAPQQAGQSPVTLTYQQSFPGCTVRVYLTGTTTLATIYSTSTGTPLGNPFTANTAQSTSPGYWQFFAANGVYDVQLSGGGISAPFTLGSITVGGGGGGCPGGSDMDIQVNSSGACAGYADFVWNESATANGQTGLQIGAAEPVLPNGNSNTIGVNVTGPAISNWISSVGEFAIAFSNPSETEAAIGVLPLSNGGTALLWQIYNGGAVAAELGLSQPGPTSSSESVVELIDAATSSHFGLSTPGSNEIQFNTGISVADGGAFINAQALNYKAFNGTGGTHYTDWGSAATTTNTILGPATVIPNGDYLGCSTTGTVCTLVPMTASSQSVSLANTATGTTVSTLTSIITGKAQILTAGAVTGVLGITTAGAGTSGTAVVQTGGTVTCVFDGATTQNDYVVASTSTGGDCHDYGSVIPAVGYQVIGQVLSTNGSAGTYTINLWSPAQRNFVLTPYDAGAYCNGAMSVSGNTAGTYTGHNDYTALTLYFQLLGQGAIEGKAPGAICTFYGGSSTTSLQIGNGTPASSGCGGSCVATASTINGVHFSGIGGKPVDYHSNVNGNAVAAGAWAPSPGTAIFIPNKSAQTVFAYCGNSGCTGPTGPSGAGLTPLALSGGLGGLNVPALLIAGPINGIDLQHFAVDCDGLCATAVRWAHTPFDDTLDVAAVNYTGSGGASGTSNPNPYIAGQQIIAYGGGPSPGTQGFRSHGLVAQSAFNWTNGFLLGCHNAACDGSTPSSGSSDVSGITFDDSSVYEFGTVGSYAYAVGFTDSYGIDNCSGGTQNGWYIYYQSGALSSFPGGVHMRNCGTSASPVNGPATIITSSISNSTCSFSFSVSQNTSAIQIPSLISMDSEQIELTAATISAGTVTVTGCVRGFKGTTATTHTSSSPIYGPVGWFVDCCAGGTVPYYAYSWATGQAALSFPDLNTGSSQVLGASLTNGYTMNPNVIGVNGYVVAGTIFTSPNNAVAGTTTPNLPYANSLSPLKLVLGSDTESESANAAITYFHREMPLPYEIMSAVGTTLHAHIIYDVGNTTGSTANFYPGLAINFSSTSGLATLSSGGTVSCSPSGNFTCHFTSGMVGHGITGVGIPPASYVTSYSSSASVNINCPGGCPTLSTPTTVTTYITGGGDNITEGGQSVAVVTNPAGVTHQYITVEYYLTMTSIGSAGTYNLTGSMLYDAYGGAFQNASVIYSIPALTPQATWSWGPSGGVYSLEFFGLWPALTTSALTAIVKAGSFIEIEHPANVI